LPGTPAAARVGFSLERSEQLVPEPTEKPLRPAAAPAGRAPDRDAEIYDRNVAAVYGQALLMLGNECLAGQVTWDVIVAECALPAAAPADADSTARRLAASTLRHCQELAAGQTREEHAVRRLRARGRVSPPGGADGERALLGLVLFGSMGYREAARELAISPSQAAALLRQTLISQARSPEDPALRGGA
jgi:hypothetical protein